LLLLPASAGAQLGTLKKKVVDKATSKPDTTTATAKAPKCDASSLVITDEVVTRYLKALGAREAQMVKLSKQPGDVGKYYSAYLRKRELRRRNEVFNLHKGPDWEKYQAILKRMYAGDPKASEEQLALSQEMDANNLQVPDLPWETQQKGTTQIDDSMRVAAGFSQCDWTNGVQERLPRIVDYLTADPVDQSYVKTLATPKEASAVQAHLPELARGLEIRYTSPEDKARLEAEAKQPATTGNAQQDCVIKASQEFSDKHKPELDAAQKSQDMNALVTLSQLQAMAMAKCQPAEQ
jgi:hypothetical protein